MTENPIVALARAYNFAAERHARQTRKGEAAEPYINHLAEVAELAARATGGTDVELVIAAVLHDTVEDAGVTNDDLTALFGARVAALVAEVTDDKSLPQGERKALQVEHAAHASTGAKIIKLADKTSNIRALTLSPPKDWDAKRRADYVAWGRQVVAKCRDANSWLADEFDRAAERVR